MSFDQLSLIFANIIYFIFSTLVILTLLGAGAIGIAFHRFKLLLFSQLASMVLVLLLYFSPDWHLSAWQKAGGIVIFWFGTLFTLGWAQSSSKEK